ncbi:MAG: hypothetical protein ACFFF4_08995 [Candidatus Thorarchaeota archaeon]
MSLLNLRRMNFQLFAIVICFILLSHVGIMAAAATNPSSDNPSPEQTTTTSFEVIQDPDLRSGVELHTHGISDEFNVTHVIMGTTDGYVNLSWSHIAGTELELTSDKVPSRSLQDVYPYYWDFCYFTVSFPWNLERIPTDAMFYLTYAVHTAGAFNTTEGPQMFKVYAWLIDSSDDWTSLYESEPPYTTTAHLYTYDLMYFELVAWGGMVEDDSGVQEDPEDVLRVGVGLAPSENFDTYNDTQPWQEYNGTVTAIVDTVSLVVLLEPEGGISPLELYFITGPIVLVVVFVVVYLVWRSYGRKKSA